MTNLFTHERIQTTHAKARHIRPTAERIVKTAKMFQETGNEFYFRRLESKKNNSFFKKNQNIKKNYLTISRIFDYKRGN